MFYTISTGTVNLKATRMVETQNFVSFLTEKRKISVMRGTLSKYFVKVNVIL